MGFIIFAPEQKEKTIFQSPLADITYSQKGFCVNGRKLLGEHLFVLPVSGRIVYKGREFDGIFALTHYKEKAFLVNHVDLEDYVLSVLPYESWPGWPDEVQKAFCISFRSYGIAKVLEQRQLHEKNKQAFPYDIKNTNHHQQYKGRLKETPYKKIVDATHGVVLAYKGKPILAMFDICCGGIIPSKTKSINFHKAPFLERGYPCVFCKDYRMYRWSKQYSWSEVEKVLKEDFPQMGTLRDLKITSKDDAGLVREIEFRDTLYHWKKITGARFKALLKNVPSPCFVIKKSGKSIVLSGRGHGHLVGLCQRGAYQLVLKGWNYKNVLKYYYPKTYFMKLQKIQY
jgi:stage II sporulation protein D